MYIILLICRSVKIVDSLFLLENCLNLGVLTRRMAALWRGTVWREFHFRVFIASCESLSITDMSFLTLLLQLEFARPSNQHGSDSHYHVFIFYFYVFYFCRQDILDLKTTLMGPKLEPTKVAV